MPMMGIEANMVMSDARMLTIMLDDELPEFSPLCYFVPTLPTSVLLGEEGIFEYFKREFQQYKNILEIMPQP